MTRGCMIAMLVGLAQATTPADALCRLGHPEEAFAMLLKALQDRDEWVRLAAITVLDWFDEKFRPALPLLEQAI